jgi:hypothetical protein
LHGINVRRENARVEKGHPTAAQKKDLGARVTSGAKVETMRSDEASSGRMKSGRLMARPLFM